MRSEEFAKKLGIPVEESFFCGVGRLRDSAGTAGWDIAGKAGATRKLDLDDSGVKENGRAGIGGSLVGSGGATSTTEVVWERGISYELSHGGDLLTSRANVKSFGGSNIGFVSSFDTS